jgi:hypothetical protein
MNEIIFILFFDAGKNMYFISLMKAKTGNIYLLKAKASPLWALCQ